MVIKLTSCTGSVKAFAGLTPVQGAHTRKDAITTSNETQAKDIAKCLHSRFNPDFFLPTNGVINRPRIIRQAMRKAESFYFKPYDYLVHLLLLTPSYRKKRSDRREAIAIVLSILIYYTCLETHQIRIPRKGRAGQFVGLTLKQIAKMGRLSLGRVKSAISDLIKAKYLDVQKRLNPTKAEKGIYRSEAAYKKLTGMLWHHLGIKLKDLTEEKIRRLKKKVSPPVHFIDSLLNIRKPLEKKYNQLKQFTEGIPKRIADLISFKSFGIPA